MAPGDIALIFKEALLDNKILPFSVVATGTSLRQA